MSIHNTNVQLRLTIKEQMERDIKRISDADHPRRLTAPYDVYTIANMECMVATIERIDEEEKSLAI